MEREDPARQDCKLAVVATALSQSLFVAITDDGIRLPAIGTHKMRELAYAELELLERLSCVVEPSSAAVDNAVRELIEQVARDTGEQQEQLEQLAQGLAESGRMDSTRATSSQDPSVLDQLGPVAPVVEARDAPVQADASERARGGALCLRTPTQVAIFGGSYHLVDRRGALVARLSARQLAVIAELRRPSTLDEVHAAQQLSLGSAAMTLDEVDRLLGELLERGVLQRATDEEVQRATQYGRAEALVAPEIRRLRRLVDICTAEANERTVHRVASPEADTRPYVMPYHKALMIPPLALGLIMANAVAYDNGRLRRRYEFEPNWSARRSRLRRILRERPSVVLFSSYVWSHADNLQVAELVKQVSPDSVTIHGGPDIPSQPAACEAYFRSHPQVDVVVRGEGELATAEILDALDGKLRHRDGRLDGLEDVPGITFRSGESIIRTGDRDRMADLDVLPSPYLTGMFSPFAEATMPAYIIETNRGCPYGCTFCDWGSATRARIRKFSLERVFDEIEWGARHGMPRTTFADANFGIFPRDVEIAEHVAEMRRRYGYPSLFGAAFAKNTTKNLKKIIAVLAEAGVLGDAAVSLQTIDAGTLSAVNRSNIKVEQYEALARTFREAGLPLFADLMFGLPGSTPATMRADLQHCIDNETSAKIFATELLVNSPMNAPEYREKHQIETELERDSRGTRPGLRLVSTSSYTRAEYQDMKRLRNTFIVAENLAVFRYVGRFVRQEIGLLESDLIDDLTRAVRADPDRYPVLAWAVETMYDLLAPPGTWALLFSDLERYLVRELAVPPSSALRTILTVQQLVLPEHGRSFPEVVELEHDFVAWFRAIVAVKDMGGRDWCNEVGPLGSYPPALFEVDDPDDLCTRAVGSSVAFDLTQGWELASPIMRPHTAQHAAS